MHNLLKLAVSLSFLEKCVAAVIGILGIHATFRVLDEHCPGALAAPMHAIRFANSSSFPDTFRFSFSLQFSLKIAWGASALRSVS